LLRRDTIGGNGAGFYDKVFVKVTRRIHSKFRPPAGKSVLYVAQLPTPVTPERRPDPSVVPCRHHPCEHLEHCDLMQDTLARNSATSSGWQRFLRSVVGLARRPAFVGSVVGLLGFLRYQKLAIVDPTNVHAFIAGDWGTHMMGWLQFRHAPLWHLPLGQVPRLGYPLGTSMIFTDSIPLLGLVLRPFSAPLPIDFQYLGPWLLASFELQGALGAQIASIYLKSRVAIAASAVLFVLLPAFLIRNGHPAFSRRWCSHRTSSRKAAPAGSRLMPS
jgi:hypothetical protein